MEVHSHASLKVKYSSKAFDPSDHREGTGAQPGAAAGAPGKAHTKYVQA